MSKVKEPEVYYGTLGKYESSFTDPLRMVAFANKGLPASSFDDLIHISHQSREAFAGKLNISLKTIDRYKKDGKSLDPLMSELILKWMQLYHKGVEIFGNVVSFNRWLEKPAYGFQGMHPEALISTSSGVSLVIDEICRIEHGDLS
jgi:putative toxin-antitoxin system antitoxin component (TIGR02293 family)